MAYLIGTDEAGYGPNLGPLVVTATVWHVPDGDEVADLFRELGSAVVPRPSHDHELCVPIADSKQLYKPGGGLQQLERGVLAALAVLDRTPRDWRSIWHHLAPDAAEPLETLPWYRDHNEPVPVDAQRDDVERRSRRLRASCREVHVRLVAMRATALFPEQFNRALERRDGKGAVLSHATLELVRDLLESLAAPVLVQCDKHGARNRYAAILQHVFPEMWHQVLREGRAESAYRSGDPHRPVEFRFVAGGESFLPAALASMVSKYLRELAMRPFNAFWQRELPGLRPTAGYPVDARRFKQQIAPLQRRLGIGDELLWRNK